MRAISSVSQPARTSRRHSDRTSPTMTVMAASAHQPLSLQAVSILTSSPSRITRLAGDAVDDLLVDEMQVHGGEWHFLPGVALEQRLGAVLGEQRFDGLVDLNGADAGLAHGAAQARARATSLPASRMRAISRGDFNSGRRLNQ